MRLFNLKHLSCIGLTFLCQAIVHAETWQLGAVSPDLDIIFLVDADSIKRNENIVKFDYRRVYNDPKNNSMSELLKKPIGSVVLATILDCKKKIIGTTMMKMYYDRESKKLFDTYSPSPTEFESIPPNSTNDDIRKKLCN